jgi:NAD dependent epimerase/dehydratase family enzyme
MGLGASMGNGRQWMSWIHEEDTVRLIVHALFASDWTPGIYNAVAPLPRRHVEFMRTLAAAVHRPLWLSLPGWPLRWIMGERAELILNGVKASSQKTMDAGFRYKHPELDGALTNLLNSYRIIC